MEKMLEDFLLQLPVGYMILVKCDVELPENFVEVDGQSFSKNKYSTLFQMLKNNVYESEDYFKLPDKKEILKLFSTMKNDEKIILKLY